MREVGQVRIGEILGDAWQHFKDNPGLLILITGISLVINVAVSKFYATVLVSGPLAVGYCYCVLRQIRGRGLSVGDLFEGFKQFLPAFLAGLLVSIFVAVGLFLLVVPGIVVAMLYTFTFFAIADGEDNFWEAMELSRRFVWSNFGKLLWPLIALGLLNVLGAIVVVGTFITMPVSVLALGLVYEHHLGGRGKIVLPQGA